MNSKVLTCILLAALVICISLLIYIIITPKHGEAFTEFYLLGPEGKAAGYPQRLKQGEEASVIVGIANHEYRAVNYTVEVWLVNSTIVYNETSQENETRINQAYFMNSFSITLNHTETEDWKPQYETYYNFSINRTGNYKLWFLLFKNNYLENVTPVEKIKRATDGEILSLNLNIRVED